jgi:hypothetical protein
MGLKTLPSGGGGGGGGAIAKLFQEHPELQGGGGKSQYIYDADKQQYSAMKKGGTASSRADGCATKGKTKGKFV